MSDYATPPPTVEGVQLSYPAPHILLITLHREKQMNSIPTAMHFGLDKILTWFDHDTQLRVAVITGAGKKAFCAGQDLIELGKRDTSSGTLSHPPSGFAGISRRVGKKPIVAAVNGFALGGGFEIVLNWYVPHFLPPSIEVAMMLIYTAIASSRHRMLNLDSQRCCEASTPRQVGCRV